MKKIIAYIRKDKVNVVIEKLEEAGVKGMTLLDAHVLAEWADKDSFSFSMEYVQKYSKVVKIEMVCKDEDSDNLVTTICKHAKTGQSGDGWIFVSPIDKAVRIKTGVANDCDNL